MNKFATSFLVSLLSAGITSHNARADGFQPWALATPRSVTHAITTTTAPIGFAPWFAGSASQAPQSLAVGAAISDASSFRPWLSPRA